MDYSSYTISKLNLIPLKLSEIYLLNEQVRTAASFYQSHLQFLGAQDVVVDLPDLHTKHVFGLGHTETGETERDSDGARCAEVAAPVGEETGPILRGFEVELVNIKQKLLDFRRGEDVMEQGRRLALVLVGHAVAEKRADCLKPADASDHLKRLVIRLFFHITDKYNGRSFYELCVDLPQGCESARGFGWL